MAISPRVDARIRRIGPRKSYLIDKYEVVRVSFLASFKGLAGIKWKKEEKNKIRRAFREWTKSIDDLHYLWARQPSFGLAQSVYLDFGLIWTPETEDFYEDPEMFADVVSEALENIEEKTGFEPEDVSWLGISRDPWDVTTPTEREKVGL